MGNINLTKDNLLQICLITEGQLEIVQTSSLPSHRNYNPRRGMKVARALNQYFSQEMFEGKRVLEFGPGHYAFSLLARSLGAIVECVELDPVLVELGRELGFKVYEKSFDDISGIGLDGIFDGIWQKGCFNACRFAKETDMHKYTKEITDVITEGGWGWVSTCNKASGINANDKPFTKQRIELQQTYMKQNDWELRPFVEEVGKKYAIKYANSPVLFTKGLGKGSLI